MNRRITIALAVCVLMFIAAVVPCFASDVAVLRNGFLIRHERREGIGNVTRLFVNADGSSYVDVPTSDIEHFEAAPAAMNSVSTVKGGAARETHLNIANLGKIDVSEAVNYAS